MCILFLSPLKLFHNKPTSPLRVHSPTAFIIMYLLGKYSCLLIHKVFIFLLVKLYVSASIIGNQDAL